jgi:minor extracellular serine protease Vpr
MRRRTALLAALAMIAATLAAGGPLAAQTADTSPPSGFTLREPGDRIGGRARDFHLRSPDSRVEVFIQLDDPSVSEFTVRRGGATPAEQREQGDRIQAQHLLISADLSGLIIEERSRFTVAANGIKAVVRAGDVPAIRATSGVKSVSEVALHYPTNETSVPWIGSDVVQAAGYTGDGVTIAVIDTGIDYTHAALGGSGDQSDYDAAYALRNTQNPSDLTSWFPNARVIGGWDFAGELYDASDDDLSTPAPDANPIDFHGHGTHVAGSAAGNDPGGPSAVGTAPDAQVYALKVFGDVVGSTSLVAEAIEWALDPDGDSATDDAVDVINMSLGSDFGKPDDVSAIAAQNAAELGVVVVVASGNAGSVPYVTGAPAVAPGTLSVAASHDDGVIASAIAVLEPASIADEYEAQPGDFGDLSMPVVGDLVSSVPVNACADADSGLITNGAAIAGNIALIARGTCTFSSKIRAARDAGAVGVLVTNNVSGEPIAMGQDGQPDQPDLPAMMISLSDGNTIRAVMDADTVVVELSDAVVIPKPELADTMAPFTSRGPGWGSSFKPEVSAPGVAILSAGVGLGDGARLSSGTSMATPHVAGIAAQLIEKYPDLSSDAIKSLIMNSARGALPEDAVDVPLQGNGVVQADVAVLDLRGYTTPAAMSFGRINPASMTQSVESFDITRLDGAGDATYDVLFVANQIHAGVQFVVTGPTVTTSSGSATVDVTISVNPAAMTADNGLFSQREADGWVVLTNQSDPDDVLVVGVLAVVDPASQVSVTGGAEEVDVTNPGPAGGFADGFTQILGPADAAGTLEGLGYRTADGGGYTYVEFGLALTEAWASPSRHEFQLWIDTDEDGQDDYVLVMADLAWFQGLVDPNGLLATALFDLNLGGGILLYLGITDLNDRVAIMPAELDDLFGFLEPGDTGFDVTVVIWDGSTVAGISDTVSVDVGDEISPDSWLAFAVDAGVMGTVPVSGAGPMLWLFQNNPVATQVAFVEVEEDTPPPPPPPPSSSSSTTTAGVPGRSAGSPLLLGGCVAGRTGHHSWVQPAGERPVLSRRLRESGPDGRVPQPGARTAGHRRGLLRR